jgi:hypothetical protein
MCFHNLHAHAAIWKERRTIVRSLVKHEWDILALLDAVLLSNKVSVIYCPGHQETEDTSTKGNRAANEATKRPALGES